MSPPESVDCEKPSWNLEAKYGKEANGIVDSPQRELWRAGNGYANAPDC